MWLKKAAAPAPTPTEVPSSSAIEPNTIQAADPAPLYGGEDGMELRIIFSATSDQPLQPQNILDIMIEKGYDPAQYSEPAVKVIESTSLNLKSYKTIWWVTERT